MNKLVRFSLLSVLALSFSIPGAFAQASDSSMGFVSGSQGGSVQNSQGTTGENGSQWNTTYGSMNEHQGSAFQSQWYHDDATARNGQQIYAWGDAPNGQTLGNGAANQNTKQKGYGDRVLNGLKTGTALIAPQSVGSGDMAANYNLGFQGSDTGQLYHGIYQTGGFSIGGILGGALLGRNMLPPTGTGSVDVNITNGW